MRKLVLNDENVSGFNIHDTQPVAEIITSSSNKVPAGYLPCDGRSLLRSEYPDLYSKIGTRYGATDELHFNLPNEIEISDTPSGHIYTCTTSAATATKVVTIPDMDVTNTNTTFEIFFINGNTASSPVVSINGTDHTLKIYSGGTKKNISAQWDAGTIFRLFYDGTDLLLTDNRIVQQTTDFTVYADGRIEYCYELSIPSQEWVQNQRYDFYFDKPSVINEIKSATSCAKNNWAGYTEVSGLTSSQIRVSVVRTAGTTTSNVTVMVMMWGS